MIYCCSSHLPAWIPYISWVDSVDFRDRTRCSQKKEAVDSGEEERRILLEKKEESCWSWEKKEETPAGATAGRTAGCWDAGTPPSGVALVLISAGETRPGQPTHVKARIGNGRRKGLKIAP